MLKILFVDDDVIARRNIVNKIDWQNHNWELIYVARDGVDALEFMKDNQPDIIISDIQMPIMDGFEMAKISKDYYPSIIFIFLSGYKEFEYAKQAISLNAFDYINKPIDSEQLIKVLKSAEIKYHETKKNNQILNEKYPLIKRNYISSLMYNSFKEADDLLFKTFDINMSNGLGIVLFISINSFEDSNLEYDDVLQTLCKNLSTDYIGSMFLCMNNLQLFAIFTLANCKELSIFETKLNDLNISINNYLEKKVGLTSTIYYGSIMHNINDLYYSYQMALQSKNNETFILLNSIKTYLENNYANSELSLTKVANHFNINHCYLTSLYKDQFGINLYDYLIKLRMKSASNLLKTTDLKSYIIAEKIGYNNSQYFSASFKKYFGCTVKEYRQKHKANIL